MDIIDNFGSNKKEIMSYIEKYGSCREHNYWFFYNQENGYVKNYFFKDNDVGIISNRYKSGTWELIGDFLGTEKKKLELFEDFLNHALSKDKKLFVFVPEKLHDDVNKIILKSSKYKITQDPLIYFTPVFNMEKWDENLEGSKWKKLRNVKNHFLKLHKVEIIPCKEIGKKKLDNVVHRWRKSRPKVERTYYTDMYLNFIKNDFEGTDIARSVVVDGEPCTITAGWHVPNSKNYYSGIGLYNYRHRGLGEIANIDDLTQIKKRNFEFADFGDSTESLLQFKKKLRPESFYKTYWFHVVKK
jgi:hypothetical protein